MSQKNSIIFALISVLVLLFFYNMRKNAAREYLEKKEQLVTFEKEAKEIGALKKRFNDKKADKRVINTLERISKPTKDYMKSKVHVMVFEGLNNTTLNALLRKIENSGLKVKRLDIDRVSEESADMHLEIQK